MGFMTSDRCLCGYATEGLLVGAGMWD